MSTMFWVSFKAFRLQNIISENPRKAFERKSNIVFFHVKVLCKHPFIPFIVVLFEVDKIRWSFGFPTPFQFQFSSSIIEHLFKPRANECEHVCSRNLEPCPKRIRMQPFPLSKKGQNPLGLNADHQAKKGGKRRCKQTSD